VQKSTSILYFESEGRENLPQVLRVVKRAVSKRADIRSLKLVIFTATGEGPALAYAQLHEYDPQIIAVTFPPSFFVKRGEEKVYPRISEKLSTFFDGIGLKVITGRLPFERIEGVQAHNEQMRVIQDVLTLFGGGFTLGIQAVLSACDLGAVGVGEKVIGITGDTASVITASTTKKFLSKEGGLVVNEILCKPRNLTISRATTPIDASAAAKAIDEKRLASKIIDLQALPEKNPRGKE
jgi:hypothetical protein